MKTPQTSYRITKDRLRKADRLVKEPPKFLTDPVLGAPRNRTELIERLIDKAYAEIDQGKTK